MIAVCDVNELWRRKPFAALAHKRPVLGFAPADWLVARRRPAPPSSGALRVLPVALPPGWASRTAWLGQRLLWWRIAAESRRQGKPVECIVVTSPHYTTLLSLLPPSVPTLYYASDDYRSYEGWGNMAELEKEVVRLADHSTFVSEALADRACADYGVEGSKVSVCMNATENRFFPSRYESLPCPPPDGSLKRPVIGAVGGINDRLDFGLLKACADLRDVGTLLLVGPLPEKPTKPLATLLAHPKCVSVGGQPHERIHEWFKCLDVGLVPYANSTFNTYCSPMRLFDHLATGLPLVCTDACEQVRSFSARAHICCGEQEFVQAVERCIKARAGQQPPLQGIGWDDRAGTLASLIRTLCEAKANA